MNIDKKNLDTVLIGAYLDSNRKAQRPLPWTNKTKDLPDSSQSQTLTHTGQNEPGEQRNHYISDGRYERYLPFSENHRDSESHTDHLTEITQEQSFRYTTTSKPYLCDENLDFLKGAQLLQTRYTSNELGVKPKVIPKINKEAYLSVKKSNHENYNRDLYQFDNIASVDHATTEQYSLENTYQTSKEIYINKAKYEQSSKEANSLMNKVTQYQYERETYPIDNKLARDHTSREVYHFDRRERCSSYESVTRLTRNETTVPKRRENSIPRAGVSTKASAAVYKALRDQNEGLFKKSDSNKKESASDYSISNEQKECLTPNINVSVTEHAIGSKNDRFTKCIAGRQNDLLPNTGVSKTEDTTCNNKKLAASYDLTDDERDSMTSNKNIIKAEDDTQIKKEAVAKYSHTDDLKKDPTQNVNGHKTEHASQEVYKKQPTCDDNGTITSKSKTKKGQNKSRDNKYNTTRMSKEPNEVLRVRRKRANAKNKFDSDVGVNKQDLLPPPTSANIRLNETPFEVSTENQLQKVKKINESKHTDNISGRNGRMDKQNISRKSKDSKTTRVPESTKKSPEPTYLNDTNKDTHSEIDKVKVKKKKKKHTKSELNDDSVTTVRKADPITPNTKTNIVKISAEDCFEFSNPIEPFVKDAASHKKKKVKSTKKVTKDDDSKRHTRSGEIKAQKDVVKQKSKKSLKMTNSKVHPINVPDEVPKQRTKEDLNRIAVIFCVEKPRKGSSATPSNKLDDDDSDDDGFRPGVWGCDISGQILDHSHVNDYDKSNTRSCTAATTKKNTRVDKTDKTGDDVLVQNNDGKKKKTGNRFIRFLRRLFRIK